ncbi:hypothetical protein T459_29636 [Capsicum annuum]|uniref:Uncharacterized protein n=1 Tax=Capsicum annuum TaxID=4072 RepID=A0A2G2Y6L4_CAPAN|nr:hypothetical protein T459_29636 [Capsicum annuum]
MEVTLKLLFFFEIKVILQILLFGYFLKKFKILCIDTCFLTWLFFGWGGLFSENGPFRLVKIMIEINNKNKLEYFLFFLSWQLGNPVLEFTTDFNLRAEYFWPHGLISGSTYRMLTSVCNYSCYVSKYNRDNVSLVCSRVRSIISTEPSVFKSELYEFQLSMLLGFTI